MTNKHLDETRPPDKMEPRKRGRPKKRPPASSSFSSEKLDASLSKMGHGSVNFLEHDLSNNKQINLDESLSNPSDNSVKLEESLLSVNRETVNLESSTFEVSLSNMLIRRSALTESDLSCLNVCQGNESWLNDNVIMNYLTIELLKIDPNVLIVETDIWSQHFTAFIDYSNVIYPQVHNNWSKVIFPIHVNGNHWALAVVNRNKIHDFNCC